MTLLGLLIGKLQYERYQVVLFENTSATKFILDDEGQLLENSFALQLMRLNFDYHPSYKVKQVKAKLTCSYLGENQNKIVSVNHPVRFHQYNIYIKDYWPSTDQQPAGVRLSLVKQPGQWLVYMGLILLIAASLWKAALLVRYEFSVLSNISRRILFALIVTIALVLLLNPMMRGNLPPILRSVWFYPHVFFFVLSYALLLTSFVTSLLRMEYDLRSYFCFRLGIFTYTVGLALGMIWAKAAWGDFWSWDPKETAALITWVVCQIAFHYTDTCKELTDKKWILWQSVCFLCLLLSWFGVQLFKMGGLHVY
ncbi:MAG: cytochrome c biogenesis protein CcsA [Bacteroidales bacterium]|nr:cytochrome c biogenesis protein CcsA [Bacteroidales bacterium]